VYAGGIVGDWANIDAAVIEPGDSSGLPLARHLREVGCPVVFTSIFPAEQEALDLDPAAYFVKPFALQELEGALIAALAAAKTKTAA
jgi:DNA-binding response OmpR family regulator